MKKAFSRQSSVVRICLACFVFLLLLSPIPYTLNSALATDSSPSADIKEKLKTLQDEIASRAANIKNEVSKKLLNKAYIGDIKSKDSTSLVVNLKAGSGNITINEFTEYIIKSKSLVGDAGLKSLAVSDSIAALGDVDDKGVLTAKRVIKLSKPFIPKKIIHGVLSSTTKDSAILRTNQGEQFSITFDKNTKYQTGKSDGSFSDIGINKWIIAVTEEIIPVVDKTSTISATPASIPPVLAKFVYIFPTNLIVKPKTSTPSATPKP